jgi:hypothetical protein
MPRLNACVLRESSADCWPDKWLFFLDFCGTKGVFTGIQGWKCALCKMARKPIEMMPLWWEY